MSKGADKSQEYASDSGMTAGIVAKGSRLARDNESVCSKLTQRLLTIILIARQQSI